MARPAQYPLGHDRAGGDSPRRFVATGKGNRRRASSVSRIRITVAVACRSTARAIKSMADVAHEHGIPVHMDGARVFNAAAALGVPVAEIVQDVDSVQFCLSKGLASPVGSMIAGSADFIARARRHAADRRRRDAAGRRPRCCRDHQPHRDGRSPAGGSHAGAAARRRVRGCPRYRHRPRSRAIEYGLLQTRSAEPRRSLRR